MSYHSPQQMRADLSQHITDAAVVDRIVGQYFKLDAPKWSPIAGHKLPASYKEPAKEAIKREDDNHAEQMENGSRLLRDAIEHMRRGKPFETPDRLVWRKDYGSTVQHTYNIETQTLTYAAPGPCWQCGAARGCRHL